MLFGDPDLHSKLQNVFTANVYMHSFCLLTGPGYTSEYGGSIVFPSLPITIKWLRENVLKHKSAQCQV